MTGGKALDSILSKSVYEINNQLFCQVPFFLDKCAYGVMEPSTVSVLFLTLEIQCHYLENYVEKILSVPSAQYFREQWYD